jgi:hypothetical protein
MRTQNSLFAGTISCVGLTIPLPAWHVGCFVVQARLQSLPSATRHARETTFLRPTCFSPVTMFVVKRNGKQERVHFDKITSRITKLAYGLNMNFVDPGSHCISSSPQCILSDSRLFQQESTMVCPTLVVLRSFALKPDPALWKPQKASTLHPPILILGFFRDSKTWTNIRIRICDYHDDGC